MPAESKLEGDCRKYARTHSIYTRKFSSPGNSGVPDRIFIYGGQVLFLEFKAPAAKPTALQRDEINLLLNAGTLATWVDAHFIAFKILHELRFGSLFGLKMLCAERNYWLEDEDFLG